MGFPEDASKKFKAHGFQEIAYTCILGFFLRNLLGL